MRFSRQGYWSGLPFPSPGDLPNPGTEPESPAMQADSLPTELQGKLTEEHGGVQKSQTQLSDETATIILSHRFLFSVFFCFSSRALFGDTQIRDQQQRKLPESIRITTN